MRLVHQPEAQDVNAILAVERRLGSGSDVLHHSSGSAEDHTIALLADRTHRDQWLADLRNLEQDIRWIPALCARMEVLLAQVRDLVLRCRRPVLSSL